ncbi:MAG: putative SAM-dependent methyltransferase [Enterobacterales bacterium]
MLNTLRKTYHWIKKFLQWQRFVFSHYNKSVPVYAKTAGEGIKLHIGAGEVNVQGWVNVDGRKFEHTHFVSDGFDLKEFSDNSIEEIYLCHVLEHFSFQDGENLLKYFRTKIMVGGVLRISVPNFDALVTAYKANGDDVESIKSALMGGQNYDYNYHKAIFNKKSLALMLKQCEFSEAIEWKTEEDFGIGLGDWSNGTISTPDNKIPISLNLKAIKV